MRAHDLIETLRAIAKTPRRDARRRSRSAWVISHPNVVAIPGASSVAQLEANVAAADLELSADELAQLTAASDAVPADQRRVGDGEGRGTARPHARQDR